MSEPSPTFRLGRADAIAIGFATLLAIYHAHLLGRGAFAWPDEHLYGDAWQGVRGLQAGDIREFGRAVTGFGARPFEGLLRLVPAWLQLRLEDRYGIPRTAAESLQIATSSNVIASFLLTMIFYRLSRYLFGGDRRFALLATVVFSLLVTMNAWIRHVLPYDVALMFALVAYALVLKIPTESTNWTSVTRCAKALAPAGVATLGLPIAFFLYRSAAIPIIVAVIAGLVWALWKLSGDRDPLVVRRASLAGLVAALSIATYPAYYSLPAVFGAIVLAGSDADALLDFRRLQIRAVCAYGASAGIVMFALELLSRLGHVSYLGSAARLSGTIALGNFDEGYVFLTRYFATSEGAVGITLLVLAAAYVPLRLMNRSMRPEEMALARILVLVTAAYLVYATQSVVFHKMAFTARYIRMYVPFVVWAAVSAVRLIPLRSLRLATAIWCLVASLASFVLFARDYDRVGYPLDSLRALRIGYEDVAPEQLVSETEIYPQYNLPVKVMVAAPHWITQPGDRRFVLVNFSWFRATGKGLPRFDPPRDASMIYDAPHFVTFRSAPFEGWMPERRREFETRRYRLTVYRVNPTTLPEPPSSAPFERGGSK